MVSSQFLLGRMSMHASRKLGDTEFTIRWPFSGFQRHLGIGTYRTGIHRSSIGSSRKPGNFIRLELLRKDSIFYHASLVGLCVPGNVFLPLDPHTVSAKPEKFATGPVNLFYVMSPAWII